MQYPIFRIPTIDRWIVVVSGKYTEELHRAPDDVLCGYEALRVVGPSHLINVYFTHLIIISGGEIGLYARKGLDDESMAHQYHSWTSREFQTYDDACPSNLS